ncbi:MAG: aminoacyl-tRNA hydrolase [Actinobacteria bacterium]|nr:aminoacyl-tRNA hydrolase [Actinomycetota bacterium]MTA89683.1 aminoacyl-tRNA hydrolase [Actinomycetota bacterium]
MTRSNLTWLVLGLGNPGPEHEANRHNIGQIIVDELAHEFGVGYKSHKSGSTIAEYRSPGGPKVVLAKSIGYMNLSGNPTNQLLQFFSLEPSQLIVVHDELDLPFGEVRTKFDGGHAGHNGLRDISEKCGTGYHRIRFGIGRPTHGQEVADYVLKNFNSEERGKLKELVDQSIQRIKSIIQL